jgi:hypothetical protein
VKKTKQGVRNLDDLPSKKVGRVLEPIPPEVDAKCKHTWIDLGILGWRKCTTCGSEYDPWAGH